MVCHYCGYEQPLPKICPSCGSKYLGGFKAGTQKIEMLVQQRFPQARVMRMDFDTTRTKDAYEKILNAFANQEADILIGTQMIVKGHDFPNVTLVGVLAADMSLYSDDYRSGERTFQLLTQAAGRAGRGRSPGEVVIQTYSPEHYSIQMAARQDYEGFYEEEMLMRQMMGYPPFSAFFSILLTGAAQEEAAQAAQELAERLAQADEEEIATILGPTALPKFRGEYRYRIIVKAEEEPRRQLVLPATERMKKERSRNVRVGLALNPTNIV